MFNKTNIALTVSVLLLFSLSACKIKGKITDSDSIGLEGIRIELSGPVNKAVLTNENGEFVFSMLPTGNYKIVPGKCSYATPASCEINKDQMLKDITGVDFTLVCPKIGMTVGTAESLTKLLGGDMLKKYREAIEENNGIIVELSVFEKDTSITDKLERVDGILLPGGVDIDPDYYGEERHEKLEWVDPKLDVLELNVMAYAKNRYLPILAICRGLQVVNVSYGGTLYQDIPSQFSGTPEVIHRDEDYVYHDIDITEGTQLYQIMGETPVTVNSSHHQGIKDLGEALTISATSQDGMVEAIESTEGLQYLIGVQFHPEAMRNDYPEINNIFEDFISQM